MIKKTVVYKDFDGNERKEDFYFNFTEAEITELEYSLNGGLAAFIQKIIDEKDQERIMKYFKKIVLDSYGVKSLDGRQFIKNEKVREEFASTQAYSQIFMELATDAEEASKFINGIMPTIKPEEAIKNNVENDKKIAAIEDHKN